MCREMDKIYRDGERVGEKIGQERGEKIGKKQGIRNEQRRIVNSLKRKGKTMDEIAAGVFPDLDPDSRRKLMDICFDYENRYLETHPGVYYEGVMDTLKELALEYPLFIVSNCQCGYIEVMMKGAGMEPYIKDFLCFGQTQTSKDQTILKLMEKNNLTSPVYVGDTQGLSLIHI